MPSHENITDPNIHEPKGVSTASEGMVYVADGLGSGSWVHWPYGKAFYQHSGSGQVIGTTPSKLVVDGLGTLSRSGQLPRDIRGIRELWDTNNNKILPIRINDAYQVRVDVPVTTETGSPSEVRFQYDVGGAATPTVVVLQKYQSAGKSVPYTISIETSIDVLTSLTLDNGIQIFLNTNSGSVTLGTPAVYINKINDGLL